MRFAVSCSIYMQFYFLEFLFNNNLLVLSSLSELLFANAFIRSMFQWSVPLFLEFFVSLYFYYIKLLFFVNTFYLFFYFLLHIFLTNFKSLDIVRKHYYYQAIL